MPSAPEPKLEDLIQNCSLQTAQACFRKLCPGGFKRLDEELENPDTERFTGFTQFGELPLDGDTLFFAYAESDKDLTERSARKAQFDAARALLKDRGEYDAGIFIYSGPNGAFRLSFITKIYKGSKADFSHFRRYTYFVDPATDGNGTFIRQVGSCSFDSLDSIQEAFSVEAINKDFYKELANWYFWAMKYVHFPTDDVAMDKKDLLADKQKVREHDAKNLIRLLTRMLFVWFIKQRGLVPHSLFNAEEIARDYLDGFSADYLDGFASQLRGTRYYKAILQNFFFAALNQERSKREFRKMGAAHRDNMSLMRYKDAFKDPQRFLDVVKATTPFLNGGLFECLDFLHPTEKGPNGGARKCYEDGFSDREDNPLVVPDFLFFAPEHKDDLSDTWGITSKNNEPVQGLIHILNRYNFTIVENSPIEQEVALDPELLGKVFENLLASYNPETQTTARKQTGSFYTPRPIVDHMVDESLKAYLLKELTEESAMQEHDAKTGLDLLFSYEEKEMDTVFNEDEVNVLIRAIDQCKILDPACGSGAFPMGILQKLVFVLGKLDPDNEKWEQQQIYEAQTIEDKKERRDRIREIMQDFEDNDDDYGRKLYLIENCLYGVDIQSIATQVSKLRFFISLVVDQNIDREHADGNFGVRPLPNLETKFVAADTLITIEKPSSQAELAELTDVKNLQKELQEIRHKIFSVKTTTTKQKYKSDDKAKREEIAAALKSNGWPDETANRLARWEPYKQNDSADFFDPEWMFGLKGFDVVIGNPPYQSAIDHKKAKGEEYRNAIKNCYNSARGTWDLYIPFFEAGLRLLKDRGMLTYISPNKFLSATYGEALREYLLKSSKLCCLVDVSHLPVFESASVYPVISLLQKTLKTNDYGLHLLLPITRSSSFVMSEYIQRSQSSKTLRFLPKKLWGFLLSPNLSVLEALISDSEPLIEVSTVCATTTAAEADTYGATLESDGECGWKTLNTGTIDPYENLWAIKPIRHQGAVIENPILPDSEIISHTRRTLYSTPKIIVAKMALHFEGFIDDNGVYAALNCNCVSVPKKDWTLYALGLVLHSSVVAFAYKQYFDGLRMSGGYLPFQAPQLKTIPIPRVTKREIKLLDILGRIRAFESDNSNGTSTFTFEQLGNACVMECYFREHMKERGLVFNDTITEILKDYNPDASGVTLTSYLETVHQRLIDAKIPERIASLPEASPELLAVILKEGKV